MGEQKKSMHSQLQKSKYMKSINKTQKFKNAFLLAKKSGDLEILREFLAETGTRAEFIDSIINDDWNNYTKSDKDLVKMFAMQIGIEELTERYGVQFGEKLNQENVMKKIHLSDIWQLLLIEPKSKIEIQNNHNISKDKINEIKKKESQIFCELLDLFTDDSLYVGIHRTGGRVSGEVIEQEGLFLTGHLSSGVLREGNTNMDVKSVLEENISFEDGPVKAIAEICRSGRYKNNRQDGNVDIILVGIPKEKLKNNDISIITKYQGQDTLNPKYVLGHVTVDIAHGTIESLSKNPYRERDLWREQGNLTSRYNNSSLSVESRLRQCYDIAKKSENRGIMKKIFEYIKGLAIGRDERGKSGKTKETGER